MRVRDASDQGWGRRWGPSQSVEVRRYVLLEEAGKLGFASSGGRSSEPQQRNDADDLGFVGPATLGDTGCCKRK